MSATSPASSPTPIRLDRLALARQALEEYRTRCFWFLSPEFAVSEEILPILIEGLRRHGDRRAFQIASELCRVMAAPDLKARWTLAVEQGRQVVDRQPAEEIGCLYLDPASGFPVTPSPDPPTFASLLRHCGSVGGLWPQIAV